MRFYFPSPFILDTKIYVPSNFVNSLSVNSDHSLLDLDRIYYRCQLMACKLGCSGLNIKFSKTDRETRHQTRFQEGSKTSGRTERGTLSVQSGSFEQYLGTSAKGKFATYLFKQETTSRTGIQDHSGLTSSRCNLVLLL